MRLLANLRSLMFPSVMSSLQGQMLNKPEDICRKSTITNINHDYL